MSGSIEHTSYKTTEEIIHTDWIKHHEMPWVLVKQIVCTVCGVFGEVQKTDTFHGGNKDAMNAEKRVYQWLKDRGCPHVTTVPSMKHLDPGDIAGSGKGKGRSGKSGASKAGAAKK